MSRHRNLTPFLDLLFCLVLLFFCLTILAFILINKDKTDANVKNKAEFVITAEWPDEISDDYDLWCEYDQIYLCYYGQKEAGPLHLERDDLGSTNDIISTNFGDIEYKENIEHLYIRAAPKGWYIVNVHSFRKNSPDPVTVKVKVEKINPYSVIDYKEITFDLQGQEKTVLRFKLDENKEVIDINRKPKEYVGR